MSFTNRRIPGSLREQLELATINRRLGDYEQCDATAQREKLVEQWRRHFPEAAKEASAVLHPLCRDERWTSDPSGNFPDEIWYNDVYNVTLRRRPDRVFGSNHGMIQLGISTHDGTARHDWREFQAIKNQLAGEECEAFELYPAESRLLDPSNYYMLWCFPGVRRIKVGEEDRSVRDADMALAPQRAFPQAEEGKS